MTNNTLTIALEGDVLLIEFVETMNRFRNLVDLLSREVAPDTEIEWLVEDLQAGSAMATVVGLSDEPMPVLDVVRGYSRLGDALQRQEPIPFSEALRREAIALTKVIGNKITAIRFETAESDNVIYGKLGPARSVATPRTSFGAVTGRVQALNSRGKLKFTLYDALLDKPVNCYLNDAQEELMREIWGEQVTVVGRVTREPDKGRAVNVRNITSVERVRSIRPDSFRNARGIFTWSPGDEPAEASVRRLRDAEG
jgi:hypothetical protein